jgi:hypothetical protein
MSDGFLSRWSRRKAGKVDEAPKKDELAQTPVAVPDTQEAEAPPPVTLEDVERIDRFDPDFSAFMRPDVDPKVQQAALKKMFTDPHFNVMDGLDIYIDDYSKPDPLPAGMLERMMQSEMLNLFRKTNDAIESDLDKNGGQSSSSAADSDLRVDTSNDSRQSALTSPVHEVTPQLDVMPIEPEQKKT